MNYRYIAAVVGIGVAMIGGAFYQLGWSSIGFQVALGLGLAVAFLGIGIELILASHRHNLQPRVLNRIRGWVFVAIGLGLLALMAGNIFVLRQKEVNLYEPTKTPRMPMNSKR